MSASRAKVLHEAFDLLSDALHHIDNACTAYARGQSGPGLTESIRLASDHIDQARDLVASHTAEEGADRLPGGVPQTGGEKVTR